MKNKTISYDVKFIGTSTVEQHIKKIQSDPSFIVSIIREGETIKCSIASPKKIYDNVSLQELGKKLPGNTNKLRLDDPVLVEKTKQDIHLTQVAENLVLTAGLKFEAESIVNNYGFITLEVEYEPAAVIDEMVDYYTNIRITNVAHSMGMALDGVIIKSSGLKLH